MSTPVFEDISVARDCPCAGCARERLELRASGGSRASTRAAAAVALGAVLTGTGAGAAHALEQPSFATQATTPQGQGAPGPLVARPASTRPATAQAATALAATTQATATTTVTRTASTPMRLTRAQIMARAQTWVDARVSYSMGAYYQGYRKDCSGYVSMAWGLGSNQWTGSLAAYGVRISKSQLKPGDMLLFHNPSNPSAGSHVTIFGGWTDSSKTRYMAYEQTRPHTLKRSTPYAYWNNSGRYVPYRYKYLAEGGGSGGSSGTAFPGASAFGPGAVNGHITELGRMLVKRGGGKFYREGPGPRWSDADRRATQAFQKAQGWQGSEADGIPGPATWRYLLEGKGKNIGGGSGGGGTGGGGSSATAFPGKQHFRPGQSNAHVTKLGKQLVKKGYGKHYTQGPGPRWSESDRRNVEAFQRAQGWRGPDADGYPGPETWRRLFR
ncbi:peptidoglycan-binding protein [Streptomyces sp. NPDC059002]|uniref:peptidoglycan-binding protein n=1 Tax=Streptomyces sp. NPDC059002 TaxID=3346690 RepID=UPI0036753368